MASRTALHGASLYLPFRVATYQVAAHSKLCDGFHFFVLVIQTRASDTLAEEANKSVFIGIIE